MARYKPVVRDGIFLPVILAEQIQPGTFEFALDHLIDHELDLSALDAKFNNDDTGAPAYDPRVMLKMSTQWNLFCLVHNIEKIARYG